MVLALYLSADFSDETRILALRLFPFRHRRPALERAQVVDEQLAVEMIDLVLKAPAE
jgi:hypothetical protein